LVRPPRLPARSLGKRLRKGHISPFQARPQRTIRAWLSLLTLAVLATTPACNALGSTRAPMAGSSLILITAAPNASPTATPFQPPIPQGTALSVYGIEIPTLEPFFGAGIPHPGAESPTPGPTPDLKSLFPTAAAPPVVPAFGEAPQPFPPLQESGALNFMLIGSDKRLGGTYRTDTLVVVVLWPERGQVSMISIPRDLWTYIPTVGMQRINTAYQTGEIEDYPGGGPALLRDTIGYNLGIRIDHTAMVQFDGFRRIVDTLGGVDVPVACPYTDWQLVDPNADPNVEANWALYTVEPGIVHMNGDLALWYARSRLESDDFDRGRRQQEVLRALFNKALRTDSLGRVSQLYADFASAVSTDLTLPDTVKLALYAPNLSNASIRSYFVRPPYVSEWTTPAGADVLLPVQDQLEPLLQQATSLSDTAVHREAISVEVQNGTDINGLDSLAASRLNYAGYATQISTADATNHQSSILTDATTSQDSAARQALLSALGLDSAKVVSAPDPTASAQYLLVLGQDYQPCFQPEDLQH
jgi:LCP family protein required for cell wall assembly